MKTGRKEIIIKETTQGGITLVALVVTIVVLIILATISISIIFDEDGIMSKSRQTKDYQANADAQWREINANVISYIDSAIEGETPTTPPKKSTIEAETTHTARELPSTYTWAKINEIAKKISNTNLLDDDLSNGTETGEITKDTLAVTVTVEEDGEEVDYTIGVGDTKTLTIGSSNYVVRIIGFNHDKLTVASAYGQEGKTNVYAGISFEFVDFLTTAAMNGTSSHNSTNAGGWAASAMYTTVSEYKDEVDTAMTIYGY